MNSLITEMTTSTTINVTKKNIISNNSVFKWVFIKLRILDVVKYLVFLFSLIILINGLFGTQIGLNNPAIILVWIGWWLVLVIIFLPFNAKSWCSVCPIPLGGQIFHRYAPLKWIKYKKFPRKISYLIFLPLFLFLVFSALSVPISTIPMFTGLILLSLFIAALTIDSIYEERSFCKNVCPINPILETYGIGGLIRIQALDYSVCLEEHDRTCLTGVESENWGCDWGYFPGNLKNNQHKCTICLECIRSCSKDNLIVQINKPNLFFNKKEKFNFIRMFTPIFFLGVVFVYTLTKIGSINPFHRWMLVNSITDAIFYFIIEFLLIIIFIPVVWLFLVILPVYVGLKKKKLSIVEIKQKITSSSISSTPISLSAWISFSLVLILPNITYILNWFSDPFSLRWNLFGLSSLDHLPGIILQLGMVFSGLILILGYLLALRVGNQYTSSLNISKKYSIYSLIGLHIFYSLFFFFLFGFYFL